MNALPPHEWQVTTDHGDTHVALDVATAPVHATFVCAHGAGGHMSDRSIAAVSAAFCSHGIAVVRFNFPYREQKSSRPDPMPRLTACFAGVVASVRERLDPSVLLIGGRSMGGRAASMLAAEGFHCDGLVLLAYPLHPPGQTNKLRTGHLGSIQVPVLCFNGTRDPFCDPRLMNETVGPLAPRWTMRWIEGADHSFHVLKRSGTTNEAVMDDVARVTTLWVGQLERT